MLEALATGDFYLGFGKRARAVPVDATKQSHGAERDALKTVALGVGYGMGEQSLAVRLARTCPEARELLALHRLTFPRFWAWSNDVVQYAKLYGRLWTPYGWELNVTTASKLKTLRNFLMQAGGSEMLRIACHRFVARGGVERGFLLAGPVHDALLVECVSDAVEEAADFTSGVMQEASRAVLGGFTLDVDVKVWRHPLRYMDEKRGLATWERIMRHLVRAEESTRSVQVPGQICPPGSSYHESYQRSLS